MPVEDATEQTDAAAGRATASQDRGAEALDVHAALAELSPPCAS